MSRGSQRINNIRKRKEVSEDLSKKICPSGITNLFTPANQPVAPQQITLNETSFNLGPMPQGQYNAGPTAAYMPIAAAPELQQPVASTSAMDDDDEELKRSKLIEAVTMKVK